MLVPAAALVVGTAEAWSARPEGWGWGIAVQAVTAVLLVGRRRWPLLASTAAGIVLLSMPWFGPQLDDLAAPILFLALLCFSLGRWVPGLRGLVGLAVLMAMLLLDYLLVDTRAHNIGDVVFVAALVLPPYVLGRIVHRLDEQRCQLERQSEQLRDQAVRDERDRIARELHDVIAHSLSAMVVQTAAAQDLVRRRPDEAAALLESVARTGREALAETGRLLHVIRDDADELGLSPQPGLADVPVLVDRLRDGGLEVDAELDLAGRTVPGGVDVSAYRVVQEALTNAVRHGSGRATLRVAAHGEDLVIRCTNPTTPMAAPTSGAGLGLLGMAERVSVLGGRVRHGTNDAGGFEVEALIPLGPGS